MESDRISKAIQRIEAAAGRIDTASQAIDQPNDTDLVQSRKQKALRDEVSEVLSELDQIIDRLEQ
ncbi:hypothetical protein BPTFM16_01075 [Altererythrobacter insulae]|nr:hypothetical protein BPTFM16_01075 [Altererythrobacter insulae]